MMETEDTKNESVVRLMEIFLEKTRSAYSYGSNIEPMFPYTDDGELIKLAYIIISRITNFVND